MEKENKVEEQTTKKTVQRNLNESIIKIRVDLQNSKLKKSGKNKFAGFDYFELADFLPRLNELMLEEGINDNFRITKDLATLTLIKGEEKQEYTMPFVIFDTPLTFKKDKNGDYVKDKNGNYVQVQSMQDIQYLGALNTYYKRYLYLNAFGITDGEVIDSMDNEDLKKESKEPNYRNELIKYCKENNIDMQKVAKEYNMINVKLSNDDYYDILIDLQRINEANIQERLGQ